jgi:putative ABC transport system ATP-binding protein
VTVLVAEDVRLSFRDDDGNPFTALAIDRFAPTPGRLTVVAGPSGSGKSTLLYVLAGLLPPQDGQVTWRGKNIYRLGEGARDRWRRQTVGFVFQDFHLVPELSVVANVMLPLTFGWSRPQRDPKETLKAMGVPLERRSVETLSRGERQRVAIARALAFDPPVILADEPTASLDDVAAREVRSICRKLADDGRTVVVVSHDWAMLGAADDTVQLEHGRPVPKMELAAE